MDKIKIMIVIPWKKIIGKITKLDNGTYEAKEAFVLEETYTHEGMNIIPLPIFPSNSNKEGTYYFTGDSVEVEPFDAPDDVANMYLRLTSSIVIPDGGSKILR